MCLTEGPSGTLLEHGERASNRSMALETHAMGVRRCLVLHPEAG